MNRNIFLFQPIMSSSSEVLIRQLLMLDKESNEPITIFINSPGGSVQDFFAIYNTIQIIKSPINTIVIGMAASASAILAAIGEKRFITEDSEFMLHEVWSFLMGSVSEIDEKSKRMEKMQNRLLGILSKKTGKSAEQIKSTFKGKDKFFSAKEAVRFGLADDIIKSNDPKIFKFSERVNVVGIFDESNKDKPSVELLVEGEFFHPTYGEVIITEAILHKMKDNFDNNVTGIDTSLDYTHDNDQGEQPAACWIKRLDVVGCVKDGKEVKVLKATEIEFTPKGKSLVQEKEYKYVSAEFEIDYMSESGKHFPYVLRGGTLTNRPILKSLNPIKLSEYKPKTKENKIMEKEAMILALKSEHSLDIVSMQEENTSLKANVESLNSKIQELNKLPIEKEGEIKSLKEEIVTLTADIVSKAKEAAFNTLLEAGKVIPAQKEVVLGHFETAESLSEFYKNAEPVVNFKTKGNDGDANDEALSKAEEEILEMGEYSKEEIISNRTIDGKPLPKKEKKKEEVAA